MIESRKICMLRACTSYGLTSGAKIMSASKQRAPMMLDWSCAVCRYGRRESTVMTKAFGLTILNMIDVAGVPEGSLLALYLILQLCNSCCCCLCHPLTASSGFMADNLSSCNVDQLIKEACAYTSRMYEKQTCVLSWQCKEALSDNSLWLGAR